MSQAIRVGLLGFGNIGQGVIRTLQTNGAVINSRLERPIQVVRIADKDRTTPRDTAGFDYAPLMTDDVAQVIEAPDVDVVVELIGGYEPARSFVERALKAGKHVVTANKALLAQHGPELFATAHANKVLLLFEAAVGGGIPIIRGLQQGLAANVFTAVYGILNGTTNYILTQMARHGTPFETALADAQAKGYAEPDPTFDIEGYDVAQKTAVLATLAYGRPTRGADVYVEGITKIETCDIEFAAKTGHALKMLGIARRTPDGSALELRAHPTFVPTSMMIAGVDDVFNAVMVDGEPIGPTLFFGRGAGPEATSSAVLSDVMALADALSSGGLNRENRLLRVSADLSVAPMDALRCPFYVRIHSDADARRRLVEALEAAQIDMDELHSDQSPLTQILTATTTEATLRKALASVEGVTPFVIRVIQPFKKNG